MTSPKCRLLAIVVLLCAARLCHAADLATLTGRICDPAGKPLPGATVMVYYAGVKKGYSTYCPSCYADCGKRAATDAGGAFVIKGLSPDLWFTLLVVRDGFAPSFVKRIDPAAGPASATLPARALPTDPAQLLRGRVEGPGRVAIADAVISPEEVKWNTPTGPTGAGGAVEGLDRIAISDSRGEFEVAFNKPGTTMTLMVEARGMAPRRFADLPMGAQRHTLQVTEGATVQGRVVLDGKPVPDVQMGLVSRDRGMGQFFSEVRIGTGPDGRFLFPSVPAGGEWYVYPKMESVVALGCAPAVKVDTQQDGQTVKLDDIHLRPGHRVRGRVVLTDGKPIPDGMQIFISCDRAWDKQTIPLPADGRFEFGNLPTDDYSINPAVKGYRLSRKNPNLSWSVEGFVDSDVDDFVILLEPGKEDFAGLSGGKFRGKPFVSARRP